jgi:hypothetical protein
MVPKHVAFAPGNKWGQAPFCKKEDILIQKMGPGPIYSQGFALLSFGEKPCPLSLSHGFFTIQPSPSEGNPTKSGGEYV